GAGAGDQPAGRRAERCPARGGGGGVGRAPAPARGERPEKETAQREPEPVATDRITGEQRGQATPADEETEPPVADADFESYVDSQEHGRQYHGRLAQGDPDEPARPSFTRRGRLSCGGGGRGGRPGGQGEAGDQREGA